MEFPARLPYITKLETYVARLSELIEQLQTKIIAFDHTLRLLNPDVPEDLAGVVRRPPKEYGKPGGVVETIVNAQSI